VGSGHAQAKVAVVSDRQCPWSEEATAAPGYSKGDFAGLVLYPGFIRGGHTTPQAFPTEAFETDERIPQGPALRIRH
jgi:hypothetical protein